MSAKGSRRGKPRPRRVNIDKPSELRAWARYWGCSQRDVRDAVKIDGVMVEDVQRWIKTNVIRVG